MTRTLLLHAGLPKTGTTTIQKALLAHRDVLARSGFLYLGHEPHNFLDAAAMFRRGFEGHRIARAMGFAAADIAARRAEAAERIRARLATPGWHTAILSNEMITWFERADMAALRDWFAPHVDRFRVLHVLREPVAQLTSYIQQLLRVGFVLPELYADPPIAGFRRVLGDAVAVFGREAVEVRAYEEDMGLPGGIAEGFAAAVGLPDALRDLLVGATAERRNTGFSQVAAEMLSAVNAGRRIEIEGMQVARRVVQTQVALQEIGGPRFRLPLEVARACHERTRGDVAWMNLTFGRALYTDPFDPGPWEQPDFDEAAARAALAQAALLLSDAHARLAVQRLTGQARQHQRAGEEAEVQRVLLQLRAIEPGHPLLAACGAAAPAPAAPADRPA